MRKFFLLSLLACLLVPCQKILATVGDEFVIGDLKYSVIVESEEEYAVSVSLENRDAVNIVVPETVENAGVEYTVTMIAYQGFGFAPVYKNGEIIHDTNAKIESITLPATLKYIANQAFRGCYKLKSISIPDNVYHIGQYAFIYCTGLENVHLPSGLTEMSDHVFHFCTGLKSAVIPNLLTKIPEATFFHCWSLTSVSIGSSVTAIDRQAFADTGLTAVDIPDGVVAIGDRAFQYCVDLVTINLPNGLETIGPHFLCGCRGIKSLIIPSSVTYIDGQFLHGCESLREVYMLGDPSVLKFTAENEETRGETFGSLTYEGGKCKGEYVEGVHNCTFYLNDKDTYDKYVAADVWDQIDAANNIIGNKYVYQMPGGTREFPGGKWVTACFPTEVKDYKSIFGPKTKAAILVDAVWEKQWNEHTDSMYHLKFKIIDDVDLARDQPYLLKVDPDKDKVEYKMYGDAMTNADWTRDVMTTVAVSNETTTEISMVGKYLRYLLFKSEFYLSNEKFYKAKTDGGSKIEPFRCFFRIKKNGIQITNAKVIDIGEIESNDVETGIAEMRTEDGRCNAKGVYNLKGQRIEPSNGILSKGLYIVNGKKVVIK